MSIVNEFISKENKRFKFQMGTVIASSLTGFLSGAVFASIIWYVAMTLILAR